MSFLTFVILAVSAGCASLPDLSRVTDQAPAGQQPKILSAKGILPPQKSKEILNRLQGAGHPTDLLERQEAILETMTGFPLTKGNKVILLIDGGATYTTMFKAIEGARDSINLETFEIDDDQMGRRFVELLLKKQGEGVQVNFMYDSKGSLTTPPTFFERMRKAGIQVVAVKLLSTHADHRKLLVVDGRLAITGGVNISQVYASTPFRGDHRKKPPLRWRDTDIEIEGPAVAEFQKMFVDLWLQQNGAPLPANRYFPTLKDEGNALVQAIGSAPGEMNRGTYISYILALSFAERSIHITSAYFIPDDHTLDALTEAARRGVDVKIILPSISDSALALNAMRYNYCELLQAGVKIYERRKALLHAKTAVIDGVWSTVGSTNLDYFSLSYNYELNAVILSRHFAAEMEQMFARDLAESREIRREKWQKRSILEKTKEFFAHMLSHFM